LFFAGSRNARDEKYRRGARSRNFTPRFIMPMNDVRELPPKVVSRDARHFTNEFTTFVIAVEFS